MKNINKPVLSINLIFRNDIRCIEKCLKALEPLRKALPCELVMADTGSTDGSREVAERYADIIVDFPWIDDFAAARNAALERSSGEWCFVLDTDEYLDPDISELVTFFKKSKNRYTGIRAAVIEYNYFDREMQGEYLKTTAPRLARLNTGVRYKGIIHESFDFGDLDVSTLLMFNHILIRHDGYAYTSREERIAKEKRNLVLLEKILETDSNKYRRILQCLESSTTCDKPIRERYVRMAAEIEAPAAKEYEHWYIPALRAAIMTAGDLDISETKDWIKKIRTLYPDSLYVRIDVAFTALHIAYKNEDWESVLHEAEEYKAGLSIYDSGNYQLANYTASSLQGILPHYRSNVAAMESVAAANLSDWPRVEQAFHDFQAEDCSTSCELYFWQAVQLCWLHIKIEPVIQRAWKKLCSKAEGQEINEQRQMKRAAFIQGAINCFPPLGKETPPYPFIALLEGSEAALAAQIMQAERTDDINRLLIHIQDWLRIPVVVITKAMQLHCELPVAFYQLPAETIQKLVALLPNVTEDFTQLTVTYCRNCPAETPAERLVQINMLVNAILGETWEEPESSFALVQCFAQVEERYLKTVYQPDILRQSNINTLPELHRFGWYYLQAVERLQQGDKVDYVHLLRQGLENAPAMKNMVDFLIKNMETQQKVTNVTPDLLALAKQVKEKIEIMKAHNESGLEELFASPIYQKLKPIIEGISLPAGLPQ